MQPGVPQRRADLNTPRSAVFILDVPEAGTRIHVHDESVNMAMRLAKLLEDGALISIPTEKLRPSPELLFSMMDTCGYQRGPRERSS